MPVENARAIPEIANFAEHGKEIWIGLRIDAGYPRFVVALKQIGSQMPPRDVGIFESEARIHDRPPDHFVRSDEIMIVMAVRTAEGDDGGDGVAAPAGTSCALLIIRARRRHVSQSDARELADVDADFHGGGAGQNVDRRFVRVRVPPGKIDVLKADLVLFCL